MTKKFFFAALCAMLCIGFASCDKDDDDSGSSGSGSGSLTVSPSSVNFTSYSAGSKTVTVNSSANWHANVIGSFIKVKPSSGSKGTTKVTVSVTKTTAYRSGSITFVGSRNVKVPVYQRNK